MNCGHTALAFIQQGYLLIFSSVLMYGIKYLLFGRYSECLSHSSGKTMLYILPRSKSLQEQLAESGCRVTLSNWRKASWHEWPQMPSPAYSPNNWLNTREHCATALPLSCFEGLIEAMLMLMVQGLGCLCFLPPQIIQGYWCIPCLFFIPLIILKMNKNKKTIPHCKGKGFLLVFLSFIYFVNVFSKLISCIMLSSTFWLTHKDW